MTTETLDFGRDYRVNEAYRRVVRALNDAVDAVGLLPAAGACGCRTPELADALSGRTGRYLRLEWILAILDIAPTDFRVRIAAALIEWVGFAATPLRPLTPAEKLARLEAKVAAKFGTAGVELLEELKR